jgi:hypothetical protein
MNTSPERLDGTVDPKLLEILVCPVTKGPLEFDSSRQELISRSAKLAYPIRDGIPNSIRYSPLAIRPLQRLALQQPRHFAGQSRGLTDEQAFQRRRAIDQA